jgi:hypothetical protein
MNKKLLVMAIAAISLAQGVKAIDPKDLPQKLENSNSAAGHRTARSSRANNGRVSAALNQRNSNNNQNNNNAGSGNQNNQAEDAHR